MTRRRPIIIILCLYTIYVPFQTMLPTRLFDISGLNIFNILMLLILGAWLFGEGMKINRTPINLPLFLFFIIALISTILSDSPVFEYDMRKFKDAFLVILMFFIVAGSIRDMDDAKTIYYVLLAVVIGVTLLVFKELMAMPTTEHYHDWARANGPFTSGTGRGSNIVGSFFAQFTPLIIAAYFQFRSQLKHRAAFAILWLMGLYGLMYTFSRGGYLATTAMLVVLLFIKSKKLLVLLIVVALLYPFWAPSSVVHRLDMSRNVDEWGEVSHDKNITSRQAIWDGAVVIIRAHPQGVGFNSFWRYIRQYVPKEERMGATDAHNNYLRVTAELGVHGLAIYLWLMLAFIINAALVYRRSEPGSFPHMVSFAFIGTMIAMCMANIFSSTFFLDQLNGIFWVFAAVMFRVAQLQKEEQEEALEREAALAAKAEDTEDRLASPA